MPRSRTERDSLGSVRVPADAYWGPETQRAQQLYQISGRPVHPSLVRAYALVKQACAQAHGSLRELEPRVARAIARAASEVAKGKLADQFLLDAFHSGAGTSLNMNLNEVLANRALELLGKKRGSYSVVHPHDHVNKGQSTNDTFPTALRVAALWHTQALVRELRALARELRQQSKKFARVVKPGRTHLQDALPVTLGQELGAYASSMEKAALRLERKSRYLQFVPLGATAVGTGFGASAKFRSLAVRRLARLSDLSLKSSRDPFEALESAGDFVSLSDGLRGAAIELARIANDFRLLGSGPRTGLGELRFPAVHPGSSIMPGKVNPSVPEMVGMVGFQVMANDHAIELAAEGGQLELNVFLPVVAKNLLESFDLLTNAVRVFRERAIRGLEADVQRSRELAERSAALATVLVSRVGYDRAASLAKEALRRNVTLRELVREKGLMNEAELRKTFDLLGTTKPKG